MVRKCIVRAAILLVAACLVAPPALAAPAYDAASAAAQLYPNAITTVVVGDTVYVLNVRDNQLELNTVGYSDNPQLGWALSGRVIATLTPDQITALQAIPRRAA